MNTKQTISRRGFLKGLAAGSLVSLAGIPLRSWGANARVVIVGGGTAGATAAKYLKKADPALQVTLIEKNPRYYTCYMSNEVLSGERDLESLGFGYEGLRDNYQINIMHDEVVGIDPQAKMVATASAGNVPYDRCIVAPGIDFHYDLIDGYSADIADSSVPHAWKAGPQTNTLHQQLAAMPNGGTFVMAAPPNPYRCPPAPYERASQVAHYFQQAKPDSKVVILDPKSGFAKQTLFEQAWMELYGYGEDGGMISREAGEGYLAIGLDPDAKRVTLQNGESIQADVLNIIPAQKAGAIAFAAGLTDASGWCPINPASFESTLHENIHVIGDAAIASPLPKSGFAANSEAKACALAVAALLNGREPERASFSNGCYSIVGSDYAISIVAIYQLAEDGRQIEKIANAGGASPSDASQAERRVDVQYAYSWYNNFTKDVFF